MIPSFGGISRRDVDESAQSPAGSWSGLHSKWIAIEKPEEILPSKLPIKIPQEYDFLSRVSVPPNRFVTQPLNAERVDGFRWVFLEDFLAFVCPGFTPSDVYLREDSIVEHLHGFFLLVLGHHQGSDTGSGAYFVGRKMHPGSIPRCLPVWHFLAAFSCSRGTTLCVCTWGTLQTEMALSCR